MGLPRIEVKINYGYKQQRQQEEEEEEASKAGSK